MYYYTKNKARFIVVATLFFVITYNLMVWLWFGDAPKGLVSLSIQTFVVAMSTWLYHYTAGQLIGQKKRSKEIRIGSFRTDFWLYY